VLIAASILTVEYHGFYCQPIAQVAYMTATTLLGVLGMLIPWQEWFDKPEYRNLKVAFFLGIAASGIFPVLHLMVLRGVPSTFLFYAPVIKSLGGYLAGVVVYANRWPEKWRPGTFDVWFSSHQLWHLAILAGIYYHYKSVEGFLAMSRGFACSGVVGA
jgi:adiponectin receptor